ncbi:MAG: hypothetical protein ACREJD_17720 [Phycisphaerales bacterium]
MIDYLLHLFDPSEAPSATRGGALSTATGWFHFASDLSIFFAYVVLCTLLLLFLYRQKRLPNRGTIWLIWLFLLGCGVARLVGAAMLYYPAFRFLLVVKVVTAVISLIAVFAIARVFPSAFEAEPASGDDPNDARQAANHRRTHENFADQRDKLEQRATQLTVRDRRIRRALDASAAAACSWDVETNEIIWEVGLSSLLGHPHSDAESAHSWTEFLSGPDCQRIQAAARTTNASHAELRLDMPISIANAREGTLVIRAKPETHSASGKSIFTGLVSFVPAAVPA